MSWLQPSPAPESPIVGDGVVHVLNEMMIALGTEKFEDVQAGRRVPPDVAPYDDASRAENVVVHIDLGEQWPSVCHFDFLMAAWLFAILLLCRWSRAAPQHVAITEGIPCKTKDAAHQEVHGV